MLAFEDGDQLSYQSLVACQEFERDPCPRTIQAVRNSMAVDAGFMNSMWMVAWIRRNKAVINQVTSMFNWEENINASLHWGICHVRSENIGST